MKSIALCLLAFPCVLSDAAHAAQPDAHTHGVAQLNLIYSEGQMQVELISPASDVLGFEHAPENRAQKEKLKQVRHALLQANSVFSIDSANCTAVDATVDLPQAEAARHDHHEEHATHHANVHAVYTWRCHRRPHAATTTALFDRFPAIEKVEAQWIVEQQQGVSLLTPSAPVLDFKR